MRLEAKVKTNQPEFSVKRTESGIEICVKSPPAGGEANREIVRELRRLTGRDAFIVKGAKSKRKTISIEDMQLSDFVTQACHERSS